MNRVTFVANTGSGLPTTHDVRDGVTLGEFLDVHFDGDIEDYNFSIRRDGESNPGSMSDTLENGDRVNAAPRKVKGE